MLDRPMINFDLWMHVDAQHVYWALPAALEPWKAAMVGLMQEYLSPTDYEQWLGNIKHIQNNHGAFSLANILVRRGKLPADHVVAVAQLVFATSGGKDGD